jgi:uncharacterized phosphosugar-binding protein
LQRILERIKTEQRNAILQAAKIVADAIRGGGIVHAFGSGHSHMIVEEAFYRAGGLAPVNPILDPPLVFFEGALASTEAERKLGYAAEILKREDVRPGDASILISNSGRNAVPVEMASEMRARRVPVIAITNLSQSRSTPSRHPSGKRLFELADVVIDNCIPDGDATTRLPGLEYAMGPASTVAGAAIMNSIMIEAALKLIETGTPVPVLASSNVAGPPPQDLTQMLGPLSERIRYYR